MAAKPKRRPAGDDDLPPELWREILNKLPVKSILRCRPVYKSWYSLISCPNFISDYSIKNLNKDGNHVLFQLHDRRAKVCSYSSYVESSMECREHDDLRGRDLGIVGSCNGLICLSRFSYNKGGNGLVVNFLIWNPTVRKIVELPSRATPPDHYLSYFGFGFDSKTNDYKVLWSMIDDSEQKSSSCDASISVCEIFDMRNGVWRGIGSLVTSRAAHEQQCYLNGAVHWIGYTIHRRYNPTLVSFDMSDEVFRVIRMPDAAELTYLNDDNVDSNVQPVVCGTLDGLIYIILRKKNHTSDICSVWIMKEYGITESWMKLFNVDMQSDPFSQGVRPRRFLLWKNNEVLIVSDQDALSARNLMNRELSLYKSESKTCKRLFSITKDILSLCFYEEGLALM